MKRIWISILCAVAVLVAVFIGNSIIHSPGASDTSITKEEAEALCRDVLGDMAEETGFPISYTCIGETSIDDTVYYVMHITWLVNNQHWSYIGNCFVSSDGQEIYDGFVSSGEYTMTELRWKQ